MQTEVCLHKHYCSFFNCATSSLILFCSVLLLFVHIAPPPQPWFLSCTLNPLFFLCCFSHPRSSLACSHRKTQSPVKQQQPITDFGREFPRTSGNILASTYNLFPLHILCRLSAAGCLARDNWLYL